MNSRCGIARSRRRIASSRSSESSRGSPPEEDVADFRVRFQVAERLFKIDVEFLFARAAHHPAAGAVAAVGGATVGDEKQDAIRVAVDESRHRHVAVFAARISHLARRNPCLFQPGNHLAADGAVRVLPVDQVKKVGCDAQGQFAAGENRPGAFLRRQLQQRFELSQRGNPVLQLPLPVVPLGGVHIGPAAGGVGSKRLQVRMHGLGADYPLRFWCQPCGAKKPQIPIEYSALWFWNVQSGAEGGISL